MYLWVKWLTQQVYWPCWSVFAVYGHCFPFTFLLFCLPFAPLPLRSFFTTMADSAILIPFPWPHGLALVPWILILLIRVIRTSQVVSLISSNSLTPATPVVEVYWMFASVTVKLLLLATTFKVSASTTISYRGYHVHHLVSARMFHCLRFV
jgi:hypothetical protein